MPLSLSKCKKEGKNAGTNAARWAFDMNRMGPDDFREFLRKYDDGDPVVMDMEPAWLSGEWAGESPNEILGEGWTDRHAEAYETAAREAYWDEMVRIAAFQIAD